MKQYAYKLIWLKKSESAEFWTAVNEAGAQGWRAVKWFESNDNYVVGVLLEREGAEAERL